MGLMRKEFLVAIRGVKRLGSGFSPYSDTLLPLKLSKYGDIAFCSTPLAYYRSHAGSISSSSKSICAYQSAQLDFIQQLSRDALLQSNNFKYRLCKLFAMHLSAILQRVSRRDRLFLLISTLSHQQKIATSTRLPMLGRITITLLFFKSLLTSFPSSKRTRV